MPPKSLPVLLYALAAACGAAGQLLFKLGTQTSGGGIASYATNWRILAGAALYAIILVLFVLGLKMGGQLSVLYPVYALTFIFGMALGALVLREPITWTKIGGTGLILAGVVLIAR